MLLLFPEWIFLLAEAQAQDGGLLIMHDQVIVHTGWPFAVSLFSLKRHARFADLSGRICHLETLCVGRMLMENRHESALPLIPVQ